MPKQELRKLGDTIFKTTTSKSPPLKRKELWTLKTRRSGLRRRPRTLWHWGLHQSCCCVTMMDVMTHSLFGFYTGKRNQDSPTDLMNYPERSEQTRTSLVMFGAVNNHNCECWWQNSNRATLSTSVLSRRARFYIGDTIVRLQTVWTSAGTHLLHILRNILDPLKIWPLQWEQRGHVVESPGLLRCNLGHVLVSLPGQEKIGQDRTGQDGGLVSTALGFDCLTSVSWSVWHFVRLTGSLTKEQRAQSADAQTFKIKPW